jgi:hypothetical protein
MKFKLYPITLISVLLICIITLSNCSPDDGITPNDPGCQNETEHYYLTDKDKSYIPYTGFDTIKMRNQAGDTLYFIGQGKQPFTTSEFVLHNNPACGNNGVTKIYDGYEMIYKDRNNFVIDFGIYKQLTLSGIQTRFLSMIDIKFDSIGHFISGISNISDSRLNTYIGDVLINGKSYSQVSKIYAFKDYKYPEGIIFDSTKFIFINKSNGILKISIKEPNAVLELL